jgi:hypothetical protein
MSRYDEIISSPGKIPTVVAHAMVELGRAG